MGYDNFKEILTDSKEIRHFFAKKSVSWVIENIKDAFGYCCRNNLSLNEYLPPERFGNQRNQITVFISVRLSELWENAIFETIKELFGQMEIDINKVRRWTTSDGDISIFDQIWEIKTSQAKDSWTGATHSSHKAPRYILVHYEVNRDVKLKLVNDHSIFPEFSIYVIDSMDNVDDMWAGQPTKNSSFTTMRIRNEWVESNKVICVWGDLKTNGKKYAKVIHKQNPCLDYSLVEDKF